MIGGTNSSKSCAELKNYFSGDRKSTERKKED